MSYQVNFKDEVQNQLTCASIRSNVESTGANSEHIEHRCRRQIHLYNEWVY